MAKTWIPFVVLILVLLFEKSVGTEETSKESFQCEDLFEFDAAANPVGDVYSPFYETGEYPNGLWCEYRITAPEGYRIKLTFKDIDIPPSDFCGQDQLIIYANEKEYIIATVCGREKLEPLITDPGVHMVHFLFRTDEMVSGRGFHLQYEASPNLAYCDSPGQTVCGNRKCFNESSQKCNGIDDCGDGTDEEGCDLPLPTSECGKPPIVPDTVFGGPDRIIGGQEAIPGSWPWQVSLQNRWTMGSSHTCGGSLVNPLWVVTAAHCFKGNPVAANWRVHIGKHHKYVKDPYEQIRYVERIIIWPDKTADTADALEGYIDFTHDIGLIKLKAPVQFSDAVRPVCLPQLGWDLKPGSRCYATGWGETRGTGANHALKQVDVDVLPSSNCSSNQATQICVKNRVGFQSTCHGDSGGPLVCRMGGLWYLMGATSYGTQSNFLSGLCAMPEQRTVFMKVPDKAEWIRTMIQMYS